MKKKNVLALVLSLSLVLVLGIGATLAAITATDDSVTNTFRFGSMTVSLTEEQPEATGEETITANSDKGYDYTNVVPGQTLNKAPEISVDTSVSAYVFVKVSGLSANLSTTITTGWTAYGTVDAYGNGVYYKTVDGADAAQDLGTIFTQVTLGADMDGTESINDITIQVAAVQLSGLTVDQAYAEATFQA